MVNAETRERLSEMRKGITTIEVEGKASAGSRFRKTEREYLIAVGANDFVRSNFFLSQLREGPTLRRAWVILDTLRIPLPEARKKRSPTEKRALIEGVEEAIIYTDFENGSLH